MSRIYTDDNGVAVNAISRAGGIDVEGHMYQILSGQRAQELHFQLGPVKEVGVNGATNEAVLAALIHRLQFLNGQFPCRENSIAITKMQEALMWLEKRTADRKARGVEGHNAA